MNQVATISFDQQVRLANAFASSRLFGVTQPDQALALMAICEAEGMHPAIAIRDYHIIQGKPALKADAMMARFQANGGKVQWNELTDTAVSATFSHPAGGSAKIRWTLEDAKRAGFAAKDNWRKFPRQMLRSRVVSEGIRTVFPGVVIGAYTVEEVQDFEPAKASDAIAQSYIDAEVVEKQTVSIETSSAPSRAHKDLQYEFFNDLSAITSVEELEEYAREYQEQWRSLSPEYAEVVEMHFDTRMGLLKAGNTEPGPHKWLNVADQNEWMISAKEAIERCDAIEELAQWEERNKRKLAALEAKRKTRMREVIGAQMQKIEAASKDITAAA